LAAFTCLSQVPTWFLETTALTPAITLASSCFASLSFIAKIIVVVGTVLLLFLRLHLPQIGARLAGRSTSKSAGSRNAFSNLACCCLVRVRGTRWSIWISVKSVGRSHA
jgi:hypothetical protein